MQAQTSTTDGPAFVKDGTPLSILKQKAKALKKSQDTKLHAAQAEIASQHGYSSWSQMSSLRFHPINEDGEVIGFWQRLEESEHEVYIDQLYDEVEAWLDGEASLRLFLKFDVEFHEAETLYVTSFHFEDPSKSLTGTGKIIRFEIESADQINAIRDLLDGDRTARRIMSTLGSIGLFQFDPRDVLQGKLT